MRHGLLLGLALALSGMAGCLPAGPDSVSPAPQADTVQLEAAEGAGQVYRATIFAPDPCYRVPETAEFQHQGDTLTVTRNLRREAGLCATVMTPIEVTGSVPARPPGVSRFVLRLTDENGRQVFLAEAAMTD